MLNILPHIYQRIGKWMILILMIIPACLGLIKGISSPFQWKGDEVNDSKTSAFIDQLYAFSYGLMPEFVYSLLIVIAIILYFISRDKVQDPYLDSLKFKTVSIVFVLSAIVGFVFNEVSVQLIFWSMGQVSAYMIILWIFKKKQNEIFTTT